VFAVVKRVSAAIHANTREGPARAKQKTGKGKTARMQEAFASPLRHRGKVYPGHKYQGVVIRIEPAPWHRGKAIDEALREGPPLVFKRLPSSRPQLNPIERSGKTLRRRATPNRLVDSLADLKKSIRASLCYFQAVRDKVKSLLEPRKKATAK
jgi:transposase